MKIKKEYVILPVIIVLALIYLIFQKDSKMNYQVPRFNPMGKEDIQKIIIKNNAENVELKKEEDSWFLLPERHKADMNQINKVLSEAETIAIQDLISERDDYERYDLDDESAVTVSIFDSEGINHEFILGKTASNRVYSYIRLKNKKGVYSVNGDLRSLFSTSDVKWRDKQVMSFKPESINEIEIIRGNEKIRLKLEGEGDESQWILNGKAYENSDEIKSRVESFSRLKCTGFVDSAPGDPMVTIHLKGEDVYSIDLLEKQDTGYSAVSSYTEDPFLIPLYLGDDMLELF